jgi:Arc/MetJ-type ribon-helix-helix transcriptional regulator
MSTAIESRPLVVLVSGGGPVGLTFSLHLTMMMGKHVKIIIYEGRWLVDEEGKIQWQNEDQGKTRRDQVVTLQDHVIEQMPEYIQKGLFQNINERVWPTSRNIPIREVEDRLLSLLQPFVQNGQIELIPENLHEQTKSLIQGSFFKSFSEVINNFIYLLRKF